jgi:hypothetical protein
LESGGKLFLRKQDWLIELSPKCLLDIMNWCIAPRTQDWPLAGELRERIENLHGDLMVLVDNDYEIVFTDLVQAPETPLAQAQTSGLDLGSEEFDEDGHSVLIWHRRYLQSKSFSNNFCKYKSFSGLTTDVALGVLEMKRYKFGRFPCPAVPLHSCGLTGTGLQIFYSEKSPESPTSLNKRNLMSGTIRFIRYSDALIIQSSRLNITHGIS